MCVCVCVYGDWTKRICSNMERRNPESPFYSDLSQPFCVAFLPPWYEVRLLMNKGPQWRRKKWMQ